jgi:hypothetical protein
MSHLELVALVVRDYDAAICFFDASPAVFRIVSMASWTRLDILGECPHTHLEWPLKSVWNCFKARSTC